MCLQTRRATRGEAGMWPTSAVLWKVPALGQWQKQMGSKQLSREDFRDREETSGGHSPGQGWAGA